MSCFEISGSYSFAGTFSGGVFLSTDNGMSWTEANTGLTDSSVWTLAFSDSELFAAAVDYGVWKRPLSEMITSVERLSDEIPADCFRCIQMHYHIS